MNALYQRSQGIPRLINIIADRSLIAAYAKERLDVTAAMVNEAANEVQLGERQVKRVRWPLILGAAVSAAVAVLAVTTFSDFYLPSERSIPEAGDTATTVVAEPESQAAAASIVSSNVLPEPEERVAIAALDTIWLVDHQQLVWKGLADMWNQPGAAFNIQAACNGDNSLGYACLRDQGNWSKINRLGLPVVLVLQERTPSYLLVLGMDADRLLVGAPDQAITVSRDSVESRWLGTYLVAWPQAVGWPSVIGRGDDGPAVTTIMELATRVDEPYRGEQIFDATFELWLKNFQVRNGLKPDGIVGRNTIVFIISYIRNQ
jgi:general secretion pathway protein A